MAEDWQQKEKKTKNAPKLGNSYTIVLSDTFLQNHQALNEEQACNKSIAREGGRGDNNTVVKGSKEGIIALIGQQERDDGVYFSNEQREKMWAHNVTGPAWLVQVAQGSGVGKVVACEFNANRSFVVKGYIKEDNTYLVTGIR